MLPALPLLGFSPDWSSLAAPEMWGNLVFLGLGASALCFVTWNMAVKELGPVKTSLYIYIVPALTVLASAAVLNARRRSSPGSVQHWRGCSFPSAGSSALRGGARVRKQRRWLRSIGFVPKGSAAQAADLIAEERGDCARSVPARASRLSSGSICFLHAVQRRRTEMLGTGRLRAKGSTEHRSSNGKHARMFHVKHLRVAMISAPSPLRRRGPCGVEAFAGSTLGTRGRAAADQAPLVVNFRRSHEERLARFQRERHARCAREPRRRSVRW